MKGEASWIDLAVVLVGLSGVAVLLLASWWSGRSLREKTFRFACPTAKATVEVTFVWNQKRRNWVAVSRCTAFEDPAQVTCGRQCLDAVRDESAPVTVGEVMSRPLVAAPGPRRSAMRSRHRSPFTES